MTVAELIKRLTDLPQDATVWCEGCDCTNAANGVDLCELRGEPAVLIKIGEPKDTWTQTLQSLGGEEPAQERPRSRRLMEG